MLGDEARLDALFSPGVTVSIAKGRSERKFVETRPMVTGRSSTFDSGVELQRFAFDP
jgi:hypothetical protein